jgi:aspartyl-tRNA(Asn)/glutamyl-tRNA(Gln) amidotransferase subunit A
MSVQGSAAGSIAEAAARLRAGKTSSVELTRAALSRIETLQPTLHAFIKVTGARALEDAERADRELAAGQDRGALHGIPYALKDIYDTAGITTTCHSKLRIDVVPSADSEVGRRLHEAGGVLLGKLATHEFAIGGPSFDLPFPPARNPWNIEHITGGSSSGSGAAVAAGLTNLAMGSDTGGSIRGPAGFCGVVGLKPTYGRVSRRGVFPLSYTLDHCGPLAFCVEDAAICLQAIAGHDPLDAASANVAVPDFSAGLHNGVAGLKIGIPRNLFADAELNTAETTEAIDRVAADLRAAGADVQDVVLPEYALFSACGRVIMISEAFAIHEEDLQRRPGDYGAIAMQRFMLGAAITAGDLVQALRLRRELTDAVQDVLTGCDALITACTLGTAPRFIDVADPISAGASPVQTIPFNVSGHPAMSVPIGLGADGLPLSLQVVGRAFDEAMVLRVGQAIETSRGLFRPLMAEV